ncbi:hypothetical protein QZH41_006302 [Actinostola sp. cb2023]|nr:hypothetical protein QZH41_006302 [Actinostola sp. cb2023]
MTVFERSGLIIFSDCLVYRKRIYHNYMESAVDSAVPNVFLSKSATSSGAGTPLAAVTKIRSLFPETWLWVDVNASSAGEAEVSTSVPDTITSWVASAFAVSPKTGFGIAALKPQVTITFKASKDWQAINELKTSRGYYEQEAVDIKEVLTIPAGQGKAVAFPIKPITLGNIALIVQAQSAVAADAVKRTILVEVRLSGRREWKEKGVEGEGS